MLKKRQGGWCGYNGGRGIVTWSDGSRSGATSDFGGCDVLGAYSASDEKPSKGFE